MSRIEGGDSKEEQNGAVSAFNGNARGKPKKVFRSADDLDTDLRVEAAQSVLDGSIDKAQLAAIANLVLAIFVDPYRAALERDVAFGKGPLDIDNEGFREPWNLPGERHTPPPVRDEFGSANGRVSSTSTINAGTLISLIGKGESMGGNFNIWNGGTEIPLTRMTVDQVLARQANWRDIPRADSSAAGAFQIKRSTLAGLKASMNLSGNELYDEKMQLRMGIELMRGRGLDDYLAGNIGTQEFMHKLSKEWAAIPKDMGGRSYYAGVGNNAAKITPQAMVAALEHTRAQYQSATQMAQAEVSGKDTHSDKPADTFASNASHVTGGAQVASASTTPPASTPDDPNQSPTSNVG